MSRVNLKTTPDKEYLEQSGLNGIFDGLLQSFLKTRPDDPSAFMLQYFDRLRSCHQAIGCEFSQVKLTKHNRMSFVHCIQEYFKGFSPEEELSAPEFQMLLDLFSPDIPKKYVQEAALYVNPSAGLGGSASSLQTTASTIKKYTLQSLKNSLYFSILYDEWILAVEQVFKSQSTLSLIPVRNISQLLSQLHNSDAVSNWFRPSEHLVSVIVQELANDNSGEVSYEGLRRCIANLRDPSLQLEVCRVSIHASPVAGTDSRLGGSLSAASLLTQPHAPASAPGQSPRGRLRDPSPPV